MTRYDRLDQFLQRYPVVGTAVYLAILLALFLTSWSCIANVLEQHARLTETSDLLARLERRLPASRNHVGSVVSGIPQGSPFIQGHTVTVAGAALLQRVSKAVAKVGGRLTSSQVELQGAKSKRGYISVIVNCDVDQLGLQKLLYDIEAGMPFLFVDQLQVQDSELSGTERDARMNVLLSVSGQWLGGR
jgi:general secretion pathway protein M